MKQLQLILGMLVFVVFSSCAGPINNAKMERYKVAGNCDMCKKTIENAASKKGVAEAEWNKETKVLTLTYDEQKTTSNEVLKRIAYAGYDNEKFLAPDDAYAKLAECCRYDRMKKEAVVSIEPVKEPAEETVQEPETKKNLLEDVYAAYFATKDALVKDDGATTSAKANELAKAIRAVDMKAMSAEEHAAWMKIEKGLLMHAEHIGETKDIEHQREHFVLLSKNLYSVVKVLKADQTIYYQHCPMYNGGADWLSKENAVKNPYYGSSMLTCGKTTETIK
ncbi:MAG: mercury transporter [Candidatus Fluviicola riflensis]|nr:MAG: mercury transporter [Candidatus Fluviicola riflensis]OGS78576.1 MAG: mercury transporter [Candidatus Fluviicola riflensis]OGS85630.1 MAG: mercury transporter [Fluviicola sp. RIFCSPHIGHO2_01_FULL_43_53]OGS87624.1 MAG: mercury transporter [Fluviicola sp. RIFCSPHIGHO2_12_FULL_43_24]